jgi:glycosyltransferase involved in cell wall biosynthesis
MSVFNGEEFLAEAVDSILNQTFRDFEFIVINDGSTDGSGAILDSCQKKDSRLRVYNQENKGLVESLNRGCSLAQGQYIARMDADDIAVRNRLMWQLDFMKEHREVAVLGGAVEFIDASGQPLYISRYPVGDREIKSALGEGCPLWHPTVLMRTDVFVWAHGYRMSCADAEDYDLWLRIAERAQLANLTTVLLRYRVHPGQVSQRKLKQQMFSSLAAQAAAVARRNGHPDPLVSVEQITPAVLTRLGVGEATQQRALTAGYLRWIRNMSLVGERSAVLDLWMDLLRSSHSRYLDRRATADARLAVAEIYWRQRKYLRSLLTAGHAVITRPMVLGRPLRLLWHRFKKVLRLQESLEVGTHG